MNPKDHLFSATYKFSAEEFTTIVRNWLQKKTGVRGIPFTIGIDDEDNEARIDFWENDSEMTDVMLQLLEKYVPLYEEAYSVPNLILGEFMKADILQVKGYRYFTRGATNDFMFYVEVNSNHYVFHDAIHEWGT